MESPSPWDWTTNEGFDSNIRRICAPERYDQLFRHDLYELYLSQELCDVTLVTSTSTIKAHKNVLAANSDYFKSNFRNKLSESESNVVSFVDNPSITFTGLSAILEYAYKGSFPVIEDSVCDIFEAARYFLMPRLQEKCGREIESTDVNQNNVAWLYKAAGKFELPALQRRVELFLPDINVTMDNYINVFEVAIACGSDLVLKSVRIFLLMELPNLLCSEKLLDMMDSKLMIALIKTDRHGVFTDMNLIKFIAQWVEKSKNDRSEFLPELLRGINLLCYEENLDDILNIPCIQENEKAKECIAQAREDMISIKIDTPQKEDLYLFIVKARDDVDFACVDTKDSTPLLRIKHSLDVPNREKGNRSISIPVFSAAVDIDDKLFIVMTANDDDECPCYSFDPRRNIWKHLAFFPGDRFGFDLVRIGCEIYAIGGQEQSFFSDEVDVYDISKNEWSVGVPLHRSFSDINAAVVNDKIFILGTSNNSEFFRYDPNGTLPVTQLPCPTIYSCYHNKLISAGGGVLRITSAFSLHPSGEICIERYDLVLNEWSLTTIEHNYTSFTVMNELSYKDEVYILADFGGYTNDPSDGGCCSLFRYYEETGSIELTVQDLGPASSYLAMVHVPKLTMARMKMLYE